MGTGFGNCFNSGEISEDAWDRTDLQPVGKGCEEATNLVVRVAGPLGKRRGFWDLGPNKDKTVAGRMIPFRRSIADALMLEFCDQLVRVWNNDGTPLTQLGVWVQFASPYTAAQLDGLRYKQVGDVIYFRHRDGLKPQTLERLQNVFWQWTPEFLPNGPWLAENTDLTSMITVTGTDESDANGDTGAGSILIDQPVTLFSNQGVFKPKHVGSKFRLRQTDGMPGVKAWAAGNRPGLGYYCVSAGRVYKEVHNGAFDANVTNPPINESGQQSDGSNIWEYRHDGAGIVRIDVFTDANNVSGVVRHTVPFKSGTATPYWAAMAWSDDQGWPRMWPALREERLVEGATAANLDFLDLTETAGFSPLSESFPPGLGSTGVVVATDAVRRRIGTDGAEILWAIEATYLLVGTRSGEYLVAGSVLDEPIDPRSVTVKALSDFGSADVFPAKAHKGAIYVTRGGTNLREIAIDTQQGMTGDDLSVLAQHIVSRQIRQLAWVPYPDNALWLRLADGGLAVMVYHKEQNVRGFCRMALPEGFICEDMAVLPGPGQLETLWIMVKRVKLGVTQRFLWMLSQPTDQLFMDGAAFYEGVPATVISGLDAYEGETVRVLADGVQVPDLVVTGGEITLTAPASKVLVGLAMKTRFKSLKLDTTLGGSLLQRQRVTACTVSLKTASAMVSLDGYAGELVSPRTAQDVPAPVSRRVIRNVTLRDDTDRDPRIVIEDETAYDGVIYSLKPQVVVGG